MAQSEPLALSHAKVWRDMEKPQHDMTHLLIAPGKTIKGEMAFRLDAVWAHPHQAHLPSLDEVVREGHPTL